MAKKTSKKLKSQLIAASEVPMLSKKTKKDAEVTPLLSRDFISLKSPSNSADKGSFNFENCSGKNNDVPSSLRHEKKKRKMHPEIEAEVVEAIKPAKKKKKKLEMDTTQPRQPKTEISDENALVISNKDCSKPPKKKIKAIKTESEAPKTEISDENALGISNKDCSKPSKKKIKAIKTESEATGNADIESSGATEKSETPKQAKKMKKEKPESHYTIFVGNLPFSATKENLEHYFSKVVPSLKSVRLITERDTGKPRGIAFIEVDGETNYQAALSLDKSFMNGRRINVEYTCAGSKKGKFRKGKITAKNLKFKDLQRRGIMTQGRHHQANRIKRSY